MDELDSAIEKLIEYSKEKRSISWDELNGMLPSDILNSDKMESVLSELAKNNIQLEDDTDELDKVEEDDDFVLDTEWTWNENDIVSIKIDPSKIKLTFKGDISKYEI